jgi:ABC-type xylose transport system permease subunit
MAGMLAGTRGIELAVLGLASLLPTPEILEAIAASSLAHTRVEELALCWGLTSLAWWRFYSLEYELL